MSTVLDAIKAVTPDRDRTYFFNPVSGDTELDLRDNMEKTTVIIDLTGGVNATVIMPSVAESIGVPYSVQLRTANSKSVTVTAYGAEDWSDITLDADGESTKLTSNGLKYVETEANYA